jgi:aubergine-like protein
VVPVENLVANFVELTRAPQWTLHQYHVSFEPELDSTRLKCAIFKHNPGIFRESKAFDGAMLFSVVRSPTNVVKN